MRNLYAFTLLLLAAALTLPVSAQVDYDTVSDLKALMDEGAQSDIEIDCMDAVALPEGGPVHPTFVFYNEATGDLVLHDANAPSGSRTTVLVDDATLDAQFGGDVIDCRGITISGNDAYAILSVDDAGNFLDHVYQIPLDPVLENGGGTILAFADGSNGIAVDAGPTAEGGTATVYLAGVQFFGAPEDGFYVLVEQTSAGGFPFVPAEVCVDSRLDLYDLEFFENSLLSNSSEFGDSGSGLQNVTVGTDLIPTAGGGCLFPVYDPFGDGIFTNGSDGGVEDLEIVSFGGSGIQIGGGGSVVGLYLLNNSFGAPDGEQWGVTFETSGGVRFAEEGPLLADPDVSIPGYDAPDGTHMVVLDDGTVYVASTDAFGGGDAILVFFGAPTPVELVSFNAVVDGSEVILGWETASETNNAGFEVQMQNGAEWDVLGWVEGHGTTTEARQYSYTVELLPGTYTFRLKQLDFDGQFEYFGDVEATVGTPGTHLLSSIYPNPFNPQASFQLSVAEGQHVSIEVFNALGQRVATLLDASLEGNQSYTFTIDGAGLATGPYVVRVTGERFAETRTVTLLK